MTRGRLLSKGRFYWNRGKRLGNFPDTFEPPNPWLDESFPVKDSFQMLGAKRGSTVSTWPFLEVELEGLDLVNANGGFGFLHLPVNLSGEHMCHQEALPKS